MEERDLKGLFEKLTPTEARKEKLFSDIAEAYRGGGKPKRARVSPKPIILTIAAVLCLFVTSAYSAAQLGLDVKWLKYLGISDGEQERYLANGAYVVDKTVANQDGTLHVKQIMGDSNLLYILMDFTAPEGTVLDAARYRFHGSLRMQGVDSSGIGFDSLEDDNPGDNRICLVMSIQANNTEAGQEAELAVTDLQAAEPYPDEYEVIQPGEWKTTIKLDFKNGSKRYEANRTVQLYGHKATLEALSVSPISVTLFLRSDSLEEIWEEARRSGTEIGPDGRSSDDYPVTIHYKDGTSETTSVFSGMAQAHPSLGDMMVVKPFLPILQPDRIESIEFFGAVVPLGKN
ncbi:DUF4179 domain-containing protein [Cohnella sp. AR92]|uniref:DUF4179 domain-containing protein n=1 Tax=Cohnella sp. AR92 TaxID=648716 RepID=UPI000F8EE35B|nr:DUF4179 domain-containing protein [Cohnella sp. AR92]RUS46632.1 DUF4179 domain-containing protein [Cohnella sp. AR92]